MNVETEAAVDAAAQDVDLVEWLEERPVEFAERVVAGALELAIHHDRTRDFTAAAVAWMVACAAQKRLGNRSRAAECGYLQAQSLINHGAEYLEIAHGNLEHIAVVAGEIDHPDLRPKSWMLAAECAVRATQAAATPAARRRWLRFAIQDLLAAGEAGVDAGNTRLPIMLVTAADAARKEAWPADEESIDPGLTALAALSERVIPVGHQFRTLELTRHATRELVELSAKYGDVRLSRQRRDAARWTIKSERWTLSKTD